VGGWGTLPTFLWNKGVSNRLYRSAGIWAMSRGKRTMTPAKDKTDQQALSVTGNFTSTWNLRSREEEGVVDSITREICTTQAD